MEASLPKSSSEAETAELEAVQRQLITAWIVRDRSALERLLAQEWTVTHGDGRLLKREDVLRDLETGSNRLLDGAVDDLRFRVYEGFAVVTGRTRARGEYKSHPYDVKLRFTDVLVRRDGRWQVISSHASRLTDEQTPSTPNKKV